jgi:hypothetical protein
MTSKQRLIGWVAFAVIALVLIFASVPNQGIREGHQGSYLGRTPEGQLAYSNQATQLNSRANQLRF